MTGDREDLARRIRELLPADWFGESTPVLDAVLHGLAEPQAFAYRLIEYADHQVRLRTATHGWLDIVGADFFGNTLPRKLGQSDTNYRGVLIANLFREHGTRAAIERVLVDLTGRKPTVFEPGRPADTGAYDLAGGYDVAGGYGALDMPHQAFVRAFRPAGTGIPHVAGYEASTGAYDTPSRLQYVTLAMITDAVTDSDIFRALDRVKPAGTILWTSISA